MAKLQNRLWNNLSIAKKLYFVVGIMALLILIELLTLRFAMGNLSAVRAFVGGEGLWSKAQRQAVYQLQRYSITKDEKDFEDFKKALTIPDGDHIARMELAKAHPNMKLIRLGFLQGRIHPDDLDPMIHLIQRFHKISYIAEAIGAWGMGDVYIGELKLLGDEFHQKISSPAHRQSDLRALSEKLKVLNDKLSIVTDDFSEVLGEGSRWLENLVFVILFSLVLTVESVGLTLTFFTSRAISGGLRDINHLANKIGEGNFDERLPVKSKDEIGQLTESVNTMGMLLQKNYHALKVSHQDLEDKVQDRTQKLEEVAKENARLYQEAKSAVRTRDEFLSIASHELRTPITALNLQLQLLGRLTKESDDQLDLVKIGEICKKAVEMSKRLANLEEVLMDLTHIRLGKIEIHKSRCDLSAIVNTVAAALSSEAAQKMSLLTIDSSMPIWGTYDAIRIEQVITNLITNALKYGKSSQITVTTELIHQTAVINVQDQGPGIPKEKQEKIFDRFERVNEDEKVSGLGLGLFISKEIVVAHGGKISVESSAETGTRFTVVLPVV